MPGPAEGFSQPSLSLPHRLVMAGLAVLLLLMSSVFLPRAYSQDVDLQNPGSPVPADAPDPVPLLDSLLGGLQTLRTDVRQLIVENTGGILEESRILFMLKRPHGFYWETLHPFPELIVTDGQTLWNYQPDLLQLTIEPWNADRSELAARLLSGNTDAIAEEYTVEVVPVNRTDYEFILTPRDPASLYQQVSLYFEQGDSPRPELVSILLINTNGQRTFWEFLNREINPDLDASVFSFTAPDDEFLDIVDKRETDGL